MRGKPIHQIQTELQRDTSDQFNISRSTSAEIRILTFHGRSTKLTTGPSMRIISIWLCWWLPSSIPCSASSPPIRRFDIWLTIVLSKTIPSAIKPLALRLFLRILNRIMEFAIPIMNKNEPLTAEPSYYWLIYAGRNSSWTSNLLWLLRCRRHRFYRRRLCWWLWLHSKYTVRIIAKYNINIHSPRRWRS